jgi:hypothetical protein
MLIVSRRRYRIASSSVSNSGHGWGGSPGSAGPENCRAHDLLVESAVPFTLHPHPARPRWSWWAARQHTSQRRWSCGPPPCTNAFRYRPFIRRCREHAIRLRPADRNCKNRSRRLRFTRASRPGLVGKDWTPYDRLAGSLPGGSGDQGVKHYKALLELDSGNNQRNRDPLESQGDISCVYPSTPSITWCCNGTCCTLGSPEASDWWCWWGMPKAVAIAMRRADAVKRYSALRSSLQNNRSGVET